MVLVLLAACQPSASREGRIGMSAPGVEAVARPVIVNPPLPALGHVLRAVLGQDTAKQVGFNRIVPQAGFNVAGVRVHRVSPAEVRVYIADGSNNRILAFNGYKPTGTPADLVIGQPSGFDHGAPNGDFTVRRHPTAATLAFHHPPMLSPTEAVFGMHLDTDGQGNLYVPDAANNRVLKYNDPFADDTPTVADEVFGQGTGNDFTTLAVGTGPSGMNLEKTFWFQTVGLDVDSAGNLWVADVGNKRVMRFSKVGGVIQKQASLCLGAADCNSGSNGQFTLPTSVQVSDDLTAVYVLDGSELDDNAGKVVKYTGNPTAGYVLDTTWVTPVLKSPRSMTLDGGSLWLTSMKETKNLKVALAATGSPVQFQPLVAGPGVTFPGTATVLQAQHVLGSYGLDDQAGDVLFGWHIRGVGINDPKYFPGVVKMSKTVPPMPPPPTPPSTEPNPLTPATVKQLLLHHGDNLVSTDTMASLHGMAYGGNQIAQDDDGFLKVYDDPEGKDGFVAPSFNLGKINGNSRRLLMAGGGHLFVSVGGEIRIYALPITSNSQAPVKILYSTTNPGGTANVRWADTATTVAFDQTGFGTGMAWDPVLNALWITDALSHRVLRIRNPLSANPVVDLGLGQPNKTASALNNGAMPNTATKSGFDSPFNLALDNFGNLYVVDGGFEGGGNKRVLRFDVAKLSAPPAVFTNPATEADAVFCKRDWLVQAPGVSETHWPNHPVNVVFDRDNHMYLLVDGYGDLTAGDLATPDVSAYERIFFFERPHLGIDAIAPDKVITTPFGQPAFGHFLGGAPDRFFVQDHTWARIAQLAVTGVPNTLQPFQQDAGGNGLVVIEAEHHTSRKLQGGHDWIASAQTGSTGEGAVVAAADSGANVTTNITTSSPRMDFKVKFVQTGTHYLWVRGFAPNTNGDFVHAGLDGQVAATADSIGAFSPGTWQWRSADAGGARATINVATAGVHTVNLWMQKDGLVVDEILLTSNAGYTPDGTEVESLRPAPGPATTLSVPAAADAHVRDGAANVNTNYGTLTNLDQKNSTVVGNNRRTFLRFPIDGFAPGISSAKLRLHGSSVTAARMVGVFAVANVTWSESGITWTNAPTIGDRQADSRSVSAIAGWVEWDVTSYIEAQKAAGATAVSFEVKQDTPNNDTPTAFSSRQAAANQPELLVTSHGAPVNQAPVCGQPQASPGPITASTTALSVACSDDGGEAGLTYTWAASPATVTISPNGTNAAKNATATFTQAGTYTFTLTVADGAGANTPGKVRPQVLQVVTTVTVAPTSATVPASGNQTFAATASDQFGTALAQPPVFAWSVSGGGSISGGGQFTAGPTVGGPFTVTAASWGKTGTAQVTVGPGTGPVTLPAVADAHVRDGSNVNTNYGTATALEQKSSTVLGNNRRTLLKFDISAVGPTVSGATLRLFGSSVTTAKVVSVFGLDDVAWTEAVTWTTAPTAVANLGVSASVGTTAAWVEWDVTARVQARKTAGATFVTLEVKQDTANNDTPTTFNSDENASNKPQLVVTSN